MFTRPEWVNTLRPRQHGRRFADDNFKCVLLHENSWISIKISLKCARKGPINNIPALAQIMAWRRPGDKPLSEPKLVSLLRTYPSLGLNELRSIWLLIFDSWNMCAFIRSSTMSSKPLIDKFVWHLFHICNCHIVYGISLCVFDITNSNE